MSRHTATGYADYGSLTLRDADTDYGRMAADSARVAYEDGLASTPYAVFLVLAELKLPVSLSIEVWDEQPADPPAGDGWSNPQRFTIASPTGEMVLGDPTGTLYVSFTLPTANRRYTVAVHHAGRDVAQQRFDDIDAQARTLPFAEQREYIATHAGGTERYLFRIW
jgi:hypothetical protein